jgi:hypothetical protein
MEGRITTPPTMSGVPKRKAGQSRRHIEAKQSKTIYNAIHKLLLQLFTATLDKDYYRYAYGNDV